MHLTDLLLPINRAYLPTDIVGDRYHFQLSTKSIRGHTELLDNLAQHLVVPRDQFSALIEFRFLGRGGRRPVGPEVDLLQRFPLPKFS